MNASTLVFKPNPIRIAVDSIIARLNSAVDEEGNTVFQNIEHLRPSIMPIEEQSPAIRINHQTWSGTVMTEQFYLTECEVPIQFYVFTYADQTDDDNNQYQIQYLQDDLCRYLLKQLELPDDVNPDGLPHPSFWRMSEQQIVTVEHDVPVPLGYGEIKAPWFVSLVTAFVTFKNSPRDDQYNEIGL